MVYKPDHKVARRTIFTTAAATMAIGTGSELSEATGGLEGTHAEYRFKNKITEGNDIVLSGRRNIETTIMEQDGEKLLLETIIKKGNDIKQKDTYRSTISNIRHNVSDLKSNEDISIEVSRGWLSVVRSTYTTEARKEFTEAELVNSEGPGTGKGGMGIWLLPTFSPAFNRSPDHHK